MISDLVKTKQFLWGIILIIKEILLNLGHQNQKNFIGYFKKGFKHCDI